MNRRNPPPVRLRRAGPGGGRVREQRHGTGKRRGFMANGFWSEDWRGRGRRRCRQRVSTFGLFLVTTLAALHLGWPYHALLVPDRPDAGSRDFGSRLRRHPLG